MEPGAVSGRSGPAFVRSDQVGRCRPEAPLTPEYRLIFEANLADQAAGGQGTDPTSTCLSPGMPRIMTAYEPMEIVFLEGGLTSATAALAWSSSLRIGLGLMPVPLRNPALAAMEVATLARLFPGRFVPAVGHGVLPWMEQVGPRAPSPMTLLREWLTATRSLLRGDTVTVSGQYVRLSDVVLDWPPATVPPLLVGARGPKTLALAGELGDGLVLDAGISPQGVRQAVDRAAARRPLEVVVYVLCEPAWAAGSGSRPS